MSVSLTSHPLARRFRPLLWLGICFVAIAGVERLLLLWMAGHGVPPSPMYWLYAFGVGWAYDLITYIYFAWPLLLFLWLVPARPGRFAGWLRWLVYAVAVTALLACVFGWLHWRYHANLKTVWPILLPWLFVLPLAAFTCGSRIGVWLLRLLCLALLFVLMFSSAADLTFWNEFSTRFNFIAVDYLVYTSEVIGNIEQSYPVGWWLALLAAVAIAILWFSRRSLGTHGDDGSRIGGRSLVVAGWLGLTVLVSFAVSADSKDLTRNMYVNSLAGNGIYQFFAAWRNQDLNFHQFYRTLPDATAYATVRKLLQTPTATFVDDDPHDLTRAIDNPGAAQHLNVVLITVESLSADYMGSFGNPGGLTPNLDRLAREGLFFDRTYANGTRTVRGLEAVTLSVPPTAGNSIVHLAHNEDLFSLGKVFDQHGYVSQFVYGGYGEFDNMNYFFAHNGYATIDRRDIPAGATIHSQNVWGVADEDLYTLAMTQMDKIHAQGKPFFLHIMTTSNHRPYTWPANRIDLPQGERAGAVKYTDWAIGDFIQRMHAKAYFANTVFVILADHCADSAGKARIPVDRYHIPWLIYAPAHIQPRVVHELVSQIDVAPTLLGLLNVNYRSRFFGRNALDAPAASARAFPSTYANMGYLQNGRLTILMPKAAVIQDQVSAAGRTGEPLPHPDPAAVEAAIAYYQTAYDEFASGRMRWRASDGKPVPKRATAAAPRPLPDATARPSLPQPTQ